MRELFRKLNTLKNINGTNDKKRFIKANKNDELFIETLEFLLNSYKITNISKKKINKKVKVDPNKFCGNLHDMFMYLTHTCSGKDIDIANVQWYINEHKEFEEELKELFTKSMKLGVQGKLVNDSLGYNLIPMFGVQLATTYDDCKSKFENEHIIITEKIDGAKLICVKNDNDVRFYSRSGKEMIGLNEIKNDILKIKKRSFVLDGELITAKTFNNNEDEYKDTMKKSRIKGDKKGLKYKVYDYIEDINNFFNGYDITKTIDRKLNVKKLINESNLKHVEYLEPLYIGDDTSKIQELAFKMSEMNREGICINVSSAPYVTKRTPYLAKLKTFKSGDCLIYDVYEGTGKYKNMLGGIKLKAKYKDEMIYSKCGSGFDSKERILYWKHPELLIGKIVEVDYFDITEDSKTNVKSLRFCTWKGEEYIRIDKSSIDDTSID